MDPWGHIPQTIFKDVMDKENGKWFFLYPSFANGS